MTVTPFCHGTFTLKRTWATSPAHVYRAWSDPELKAQWFTGPKDLWTMTRRSIDFREGGTEILEGRFNESGSTGLYEARFHLIEPDQRIIYDYDLHHGGRFHSVANVKSTPLATRALKNQRGASALISALVGISVSCGATIGLPTFATASFTPFPPCSHCGILIH